MDLLKDKNFFPKDIRVPPEPTPIAVELIEASSNKGPTATFSTQTMLLFKREWRTLKRAPTLFVTSTVAAAVLSVVSSILLLGIGAKDKAINGVRIFVVVTGILSVLTCYLLLDSQLLCFPSPHSLSQVVAGIFGSLISMFLQSLLLTSANIISWFAFERPLFLKEYSTKHYGVLPYLGSKFVFDTLQTFFIVLIMVNFCYTLMSFIDLRLAQIISSLFCCSSTVPHRLLHGSVRNDVFHFSCVDTGRDIQWNCY